MSLRNEFYRFSQDRAEKADSYIDKGDRILARAGRRTARIEDRRLGVLQDLGSDAQLDPSIYEGYQDFLVVPQATMKNWKGSNRRGLKRRYESATAANDLFKKSHEAARAGDYETATALRDQAMGYVSGTPLERFLKPHLGVDPIASSPTGQLVGQVVRDARGLLDRNSPSAEAFKSSLIDGAVAAVDAAETSANRSLATQERTAQRQQRDFGLARGSAYSSTGAQAIAARSAERFAGLKADVALQAGAGRAQIHADAAAFYEQYSRQWAVNAAATAQDFINNAPHIRDTYVALRNEIDVARAELMGVGAQVAGGISQSSIQEAGAIDRARIAARQESKNNVTGIITGIATIALGAVTAGVGTAIGSAALVTAGNVLGGVGRNNP